MRHALVTGITVLAAFSSAAHAEAQAPRIFLGGGVITDKDGTGSAISQSTLISWTIVAGLEAPRHFGIRAVFEAPHEDIAVSEGTYRRPESTFPIHEQLTYTRRTMTYGVLGDVHGHILPLVRLAGTFGFVTVTHDSTQVVARQQVRPDGTRVSLPDDRRDGDHDWTGLAVGVEAAVALVPHLEIVPELRVILFGPYESNHIVRSGLGVRWRF